MTTTAPKPFVKFVGGKTQLVPQLLERFPLDWNAEMDLYIEPFVGGGALFFALQPKNAILNDVNADLMNVYANVRDDVEALSTELQEYEAKHRQRGEAFYYFMRDSYNARSPSIGWAATFIFLNKTCFNGLYRVNKAGQFNVPWGKNPKATICDAENLRLCSAALHDTLLLSEDALQFAWNEDRFGTMWRNPVIYCDPPFTPVSKTSNFTRYTPGGFTYADQIRLLARAVEWRHQGAHVILSQAADEVLIEQYRRCGFTCDRVQARRAINSKGSRRGPVGEYIICGGR
jgi:DNA adenine methylase